ncbi:MAG: hypothetical protein VB139_05895 [Coriobacteriia bacterium]|nr:hypothetical protein [Coriobacteriia bacterium]
MMTRTASRASSQAQELPVAVDARRCLLEFYRARDRQDAERCASGQQSTRGTVYAMGVERLESNAEVYESYRVLRAAGVELSPKVEATLARLPQDWRQVCRVDKEGRLWTASLREKKSSW